MAVHETTRSTTQHARLAALKRHRPNDTAAHDAAQRDLRAAILEERIARDVAAWPPFTPEQRDRLALILRGGTAPPGAARTTGRPATNEVRTPSRRNLPANGEHRPDRLALLLRGGAS